MLLSSGMFFCAFIIERSSKEYYFYPAKRSKIYWLQPGRQHVGDQVFGAFMGVNEGPYSEPTKDLTYIKSTKTSKYTDKTTLLIFTVSLTGIGFVIQFVGLRGLQPSVIMAQMGATLIMSVVRTCLRTKRIDSEENQLLSEDRDLTSHNQQELDCFAFHLENIESFEILSSRANDLQDSQYAFDSETTVDAESSEYTTLKTNIIQTRTRLAELTSGINKPPNMAWNDLPIRKIAQNLAHTIEMTMDLVSTWVPKPSGLFGFKLGFRCQLCDGEPAEIMEDGNIRLGSSPILDYHTIRLERSDDTLRWKVNEKELEAILGLWTWSLLKSDGNWLQKGLGRLVGLDDAEARKESTDLYFHKWIYRQTEARMVPSTMIDADTRLFGFYSDELSDDKEILVVKTQNGLKTMAAQDIYISFLNAILRDLDELGGTVDVLTGSQGTYFAQSDRLDELVTCFESGKLGSREEALLCIVPVLRRQNLLPELAADLPSIRKRIEQYIESENWTEAFSIVRWLCERCDGREFERSVFYLGYLCRQAMLHSDCRVRHVGLEEVCSLLKGDMRAGYFEKLRSSRKTGWMCSQQQLDWWDVFSKQLGWCAWHLAEHSPDKQHFQPALSEFGITEESIPTCRFNGNGELAERGRASYLQWVSYEEKHIYSVDGEDALPHLAFDWARLNNYDFLLHCLLLVWMGFREKQPGFLHNVILMAARCRLCSALQTMLRLDLDIDLPEPYEGKTPLIQAALENDAGAVQELIDNGAQIDGRSENGRTALMSVAYSGQCDMVKFLIQRGASINAQDDDGITALISATFSNQIEVIKTLLEAGADTEKAGSDLSTPLVVAVDENHLDVLRLLLQHGANPNVQLQVDESTPIMGAIRRKFTDAVRILLSWNADLQKKDWNGNTALELAKSWECFEIVSILEDAMEIPQIAST